MFGKLVRALLISTAATMGAVLVLRHLEKTGQGAVTLPPRKRVREVDADRLSAGERDALLQELEAQL